MFECSVVPTPDDDVTRPLPLSGGAAAPAGLSGDEAGYISYEGRHRGGPSKTGVRTVAAAALFSVPTAGLAVAVMAPEPGDATQSLRADLASNATDLGTASMSLERQASPSTSFAPVAAPTSGADIVDAQIVESQKLPVPEQEVQDPSLEEGTRTVVDPGREGERSVIWRVTYDKGREVARDRIGAGQDTPATPRVVKVGTKKKAEEIVEKAKSAAPAVSNGATWDKLAKCESGGDWSTDTGNGYQGGLQFDKQTWQSYGGDQYAPTADQASREEQISVAEKVKDDRGGYSAWPSCSSKLGLS
ncbi:Cell wall-binding protein [Pseudonocardia sp. Ae168_Ps1]|uniref:resuscitation-promoting factor n=1 Tax=unclassified Pseudonocardia TaxID=2619320 RepID=UPI00094AF523|nr:MULTISPECIES: transglycosylase family protein [unclassified Pseudonocardia]OLL75617.1 Cell wall-binding protein [Pseudonocardia sp. Ae150A_Ps1]OLL81614.1 Cell wall-binding protein [Pseudonocardia sp. Ae168_Ps1]OLL84272.1 Cell wall-binding protein [Pseudonocardia sp. Ae263_Ps1]OLL95709.1 Cell wall-binding protein [Pseudonocardia sp. Ae356_Ps1]